MSVVSIRPAYDSWPKVNDRLRDAVARLTHEQLALQPGSDRWPLWASVGHLACQRVFWLCDFAGQPGADTTPFTNAAYNCPGDDDLDHVLTAVQLADALDATFRIVEAVLDEWPASSLGDVLRRPEWDGSWVHTRGAVVQRVFAHDVWHTAELNEALTRGGLSPIDLWD
jgi:uncharacterized damage-inducible protein DinB